MSNEDWSPAEVNLTAQDYFGMLEKELAGEPFNKAEHNRTLQTKLSGRSKAAIELKHQNISAVLNDLGYAYIKGYKPRGNIQRILKDVVKGEAERRGIPTRAPGALGYPLESHSWTVYSPTVAVKAMDKSSFLHHGSGIPKEIVSFFRYSPDAPPKQILLLHGGVRYPATLTPDNEDQRDRVRLFWRGGFSKLIADVLPHHFRHFSTDIEPSGAAPEMRFERFPTEVDTYKVEFLLPEDIRSDAVPADFELESPDGRQEGASKQRLTTVYERDPRNRLAAIRIHGTRCLACGFDFGEAYGVWGAGYIEVHHLFSLATQDEERVVNPATDLVPVCANCHRMFHRKKDKILNVEDIQKLVQDHS